MLPRQALFLLALLRVHSVDASTPAPLLGAEFTSVPSALCDIIPSSIGRFVIPGTSTLAPVDAQGWPTADAALEVFDARPSGTPPVDPLAFVPSVYGAYSLSFVGKGTVVVPDVLNFTLTDLAFDPVSFTTSATLTLLPPLPALAFAIAGSQRTPSSPPGSGFQRLRLLQPPTPLPCTGLFTPQAVAAVAPFAHLRFMQWSYGYWVDNFTSPASPGAPSIAWENRMLLSDAVWQPRAGAAGAPWETVVLFAQRAGKSLWLTAPVQATDAYIHSLALLLRDGSADTGGVGVPAGCALYLEHGNEVFLNASVGGPSATYAWNRAAAAAEVAADPASPLARGSSDPEVWGYRRHLLRLTQISAIVRSVFGAAAAPRIRAVLGWTMAFPAELADLLQWYEGCFGPLPSALYGVAVNSYAVAGIVPGSTQASVLAQVRSASQANVPLRAAIAGILGAHSGLRLLSYEGALVAIPVGGSARETTGTIIQANRAAGWGAEMVRDFAAWGAAGGGEFNFFALASQYGEDAPAPVYQWGLTEDTHALNTSKLDAVRDILRGGA